MGESYPAGDFVELDVDDTRWSPPEAVTSHSGTPVESNADFFADPPPEIGELMSAETTLKDGARPWRTASRLALAGLVGWIAAMAIDLWAANKNPADLSMFRTLEFGLFFLLVLITWYLTRFRHTCNYVGKFGLAQVRCKGNRTRLLSPDVFLFETADELRTSQTRNYYNGIYTGTNYAYSWTVHEGTRAYKLSGNYRGENSPPKAKDPFHFATMAEHAWSAYLFERIIAELQTRQTARFNLSGRYFVSIGPGFLILFTSGTEPVRLSAEEIGGIQIESGVVKIKRVDAKEGWFSSTGVYKFSYDHMANSRLFLILYSHLIGQ